MTRRLRIFTVILSAVVVAAAGLGAYRLFRGGENGGWTVPDELKFRPIGVVTAHAVLVECPLATTAVVSGDTTNGLYRGIFERAGVCSAFEVREPDIVFAVGDEADWRTLSKTLVSSNGVYAWAFDTRRLSVRDFRDMLASFSKPLINRGSEPEVHLWVVGENDWLLVGHPERPSVRLADMLERMAAEGVAEELVEVSCDSLSELLANYVDTDMNLMGAFDGDMSVPVRPEFFYSRGIPDVGWIDDTDVDEDIRTTVIGDFHACQLARRSVVEGNMLALEEGKMEEAIDKWSAALARNPHDTMLLDRLYRLTVNARAFERVGNWKAAAKCYETLVSVRPSDAAAMIRFGACMQALGEKEIAEKALAKGKEMMR